MKTFLQFITCTFCLFISLHADFYQHQKSSIFSLQISNYQKLLNSFKDSPEGQFWYSKEMQAFRKPLEDSLDQQYQKLSKEAHLPQGSSLLDLFNGKFMLDFSNLKYSTSENRIEEISIALIFEREPTSKLYNALLKYISENEDLKQNRKDIKHQGISFRTFLLNKIPHSTSSLKNTTKNLQLSIGSIGNHTVIHLGNPNNALQQLSFYVQNIKAKKFISSKDDFNLQMNYLPIWHLIESLLDKTQQDLQEKMTKGQLQGQQMFLAGLQLKPLTQALGIFDIKSFNLSFSHMAKGLHGKSSLKFSDKPKGLCKFFIPNAHPYAAPIPNWLPEDVWVASSHRVPISNYLTIIKDFINKQIPLYAPFILGKLQQTQISSGIDLEKDIFHLSDDQLYQVQLASKDKLVSLEKNRDIYFLTLKNKQKFENNFIKWLSSLPFFKPSKSEYKGSTWYTIHKSGSVNESIIFAFYQKYFIVTAAKDDLQQFITLMQKSPKNLLSKSKKFQSYFSNLPRKNHGVTYQNINLIIRSIIKFLKSNTQLNASAHSLFNPKLLPNIDQMKIDFGTSLHVNVVKEMELQQSFQLKY